MHQATAEKRLDPSNTGMTHPSASPRKAQTELSSDEPEIRSQQHVLQSTARSWLEGSAMEPSLVQALRQISNTRQSVHNQKPILSEPNIQLMPRDMSQLCSPANTNHSHRMPSLGSMSQVTPMLEQGSGFIRPDQARKSFELSVRQWQHLDAVLRQRGVMPCHQRGWPLEPFAAALCEAIRDAELG